MGTICEFLHRQNCKYRHRATMLFHCHTLDRNIKYYDYKQYALRKHTTLPRQITVLIDSFEPECYAKPGIPHLSVVAQTIIMLVIYGIMVLTAIYFLNVSSPQMTLNTKMKFNKFL